MAKKPSKYSPEFRAYMRHMVDKLKTLVYAFEYDCDIFYHEEENQDEYVEQTIRIDLSYLTFKLNIYPLNAAYWERKQFEKLGNIVLHEMCHILFEPVWVFAKESESTINSENRRVVLERQVVRTQRSIADVLDMADPKWFMPPAPTAKGKKTVAK